MRIVLVWTCLESKLLVRIPSPVPRSSLCTYSSATNERDVNPNKRLAERCVAVGDDDFAARRTMRQAPIPNHTTSSSSPAILTQWC